MKTVFYSMIAFLAIFFLSCAKDKPLVVDPDDGKNNNGGIGVYFDLKGGVDVDGNFDTTIYRSMTVNHLNTGVPVLIFSRGLAGDTVKFLMADCDTPLSKPQSWNHYVEYYLIKNPNVANNFNVQHVEGYIAVNYGYDGFSNQSVYGRNTDTIWIKSVNPYNFGFYEPNNKNVHDVYVRRQ